MKSGEGIWGERRRAPGELDANQQDYASMVAKANALQGSLPGKLDPRYQLGLTVDDYSAPEFLWLRRGGLWQAGISFAAIPANRLALYLSVASDRLVVVEKVVISNPGLAPDTYTIGYSDTPPFPAAGTALFRDTRQTPNSCPVAVSNGGIVAPAPFLTGSSLVSVAINATEVVEGPWILTPNAQGIRFGVVSTAANNAACITAYFWERGLISSER